MPVQALAFARSEAERVVAAGGDGTMNSVAAAIIESHVLVPRIYGRAPRLPSSVVFVPRARFDSPIVPSR